MRTFRLNRRRLGFLIGTRSALAAGVGLLLSGKLAPHVRRAVGLGLIAFGALTTIPAVRMIRSGC
jgi:hypothetical protein